MAKVLYLRKAEVERNYAELAALSGLSEETLKRSLKGKREMGVSELVAISRALDIDPVDVAIAAKARLQNKSL